VHPLIRVSCFLVFAALLAVGGSSRLWVAAALIAVISHFFLPRSVLRSALAMSRRLRWLFLSLLIVYGWFSPGDPVWQAPDAVPWLSALLPGLEGLQAGLARALALVLIVFAVRVLLFACTREELMAAVYGLALPLAAFGLARERLALRMVLVMDAVEETRALVGERLALRAGGVPRLRAIGDFAAGLIREIGDRSGRRAGEPVELVLAGAPPPWQWIYPLVLGLALYAAGRMLPPLL
jgi:energy-coupling factor transport system permease protein